MTRSVMSSAHVSSAQSSGNYVRISAIAVLLTL